MAQQYTQITLREMDTFLKRAFRALHPRTTSVMGETVIDLFLNDAKTIGVRIFTSVAQGRDLAAQEGADAIRVGFYNFALNRPMIPGKYPIVKRTQGWRDNLQDRIETFMELYDEKEEYWESRTRG